MLKALIQRLYSVRRRQTSISGFTLIELLVSIIIATILVGTLLGFLVNILERDRNEQAKVEAQEEVQSALNFIANDLTEAVYIYDSDGLYQNGTDLTSVVSQLPHRQVNSSICNPSTNRCTPVLVFWKRFRYDRDDLVKGGSSPTKNRAVRCLDETAQQAVSCIGGDRYIFSLVVYYLVKGQTSDSTWSSASRIVRWELKDGIVWNCLIPGTCPTAANQRVVSTGTDGGVLGTVYAVLPDLGFSRFDLSGAGTLSDRMNRWRKSTTAYNFAINGFDELVDFVDDTPYDATQDDGTIGNSPAGARVDINIIGNTLGNFVVTPPIPSTNLSCDNPDIGVGVGLTLAQLGTAAQTTFAQRIPPDFSSTTTINGVNVNPIGLSSFYTCVNAARISARVYIRTNALARLVDGASSRQVSDSVFEGFLPTVNLRVFGRGSLSVDE